MKITTPWRRFLGQNIKGTPAMSQTQVLHDLKVVKRKADVVVVQEFKWAWYWRALAVAMPFKSRNEWRSFPANGKGFARPIVGGQPVLWRRLVWRRKATFRRLLHDGAAGISDTRYLRATLLQDRTVDTELCAWFGGTHFVVGGDGPRDGAKRKAMLALNLQRLDAFLTEMAKTGWPILFELDANIHKGTKAYAQLLSIVKKHGGRFYGGMGVEYLFVIDGDKATVEVDGDWVLSTSELYTDHEGRGVTFRLVAA